MATGKNDSTPSGRDVEQKAGALAGGLQRRTRIRFDKRTDCEPIGGRMELRSLAIWHARLPAAKVSSTLRMEVHVPIAMAFASLKKTKAPRAGDATCDSYLLS